MLSKLITTVGIAMAARYALLLPISLFFEVLPSTATPPNRDREIEITCSHKISFSPGVSRRHRAEVKTMFRNRCYFRIAVGPVGDQTSPSGAYLVWAEPITDGLVFRGSYPDFIEWLRKQEAARDFGPEHEGNRLGTKEFEVIGFSPHDKEKEIGHWLGDIVYCAPDGGKVVVSQRYQHGELFHVSISSRYACRPTRHTNDKIRNQ